MISNFEIELPCDNDGFVLMQCPICGDLFKLRPDDIEDDQVFEICCPLCGLSSSSFFTDEVLELVCAKSENIVLEQLYGEMKKLEKQIKSKSVSFKSGKKPKPKPEHTLTASIDSFIRVKCKDCGREAKVNSLLAMSMYTCPCCGIGQFYE